MRVRCTAVAVIVLISASAMTVPRSSAETVSDCRVEGSGSFSTGESWEFWAESSDTDPLTAEAKGIGRHTTADGRMFVFRVGFMRCRLNGGRVVDFAGRFVEVERAGGSGAHDDICPPFAGDAGGGCDVRVTARDDGEVDDYAFRVIGPIGETAYFSSGPVADNGEITITPF